MPGDDSAAAGGDDAVPDRFTRTTRTRQHASADVAPELFAVGES